MPDSNVQPESSAPVRRWLLIAALPILLHLITLRPDEPVYNGDANRHAMTSVFFRDLLIDQPLDHPRQYAENYYRQYPALGLMIWPPLFHGVTGLLMTIFGTSATVPRALVFLCFLFSLLSLHKLCRRRMPDEQAIAVVVIFSVMPMIFEFSRFIMLEMPTLAMCLFSIEQFDFWLRHGRSKHLYIAATAAALAALIRFDAIVLLPVLLSLAVLEGRWKQLLNWHIPLAAILALIIVSPTYAVIWHELGDLHVRQAAESVSGTTEDLARMGGLEYYPLCIPIQAGWVAAIFFWLGVIAATAKAHRSAAALFVALLLGTFVIFSPLAEHRPRHAIYWLPAIAYFASVGALALAKLIHRLTTWQIEKSNRLAFGTVICATAVSSFCLPPHRVTGYAAAAEAALAASNAGDHILIDGWWDGNITYHLRHLDNSRSRHIVRADHVIYDFTNVPSVDFEQFVESDTEILQVIADSKAVCIIFEDPQPFGSIPISTRMHEVVESLPDQFPLQTTIPVDLNFPCARPFALKIFRVNKEQLHTYLNKSGGSQKVSSLHPWSISKDKPPCPTSPFN